MSVKDLETSLSRLPERNVLTNMSFYSLHQPFPNSQLLLTADYL